MIGSPGTGKTMLSRRLPTILPPLTPEESLETTRIYSALGRLKPDEPLLATRPFRDPHHTISDAGMVGGGRTPAPGEISLAHHGVLFLDELPEFNRARQAQKQRFGPDSKRLNGRMTSKQLRRHCILDEEGKSLLESAMENLGLSARAHDRILRMARTIADMEGTENLKVGHVSE